jgi:predicted RNase H-like HicB family nuclease
MKYRYSMIIQWSDEDNCYLVHLPKFPWQQFHTHDKTYEEAVQHGQEVIKDIEQIVDYIANILFMALLNRNMISCPVAYP